MARSRIIKPSLFKNEVLGVADPLLTILFEGLWMLADQNGVLEERPARIKAEIFPYRDISKKEMTQMLVWLAKNGFIFRYKSAQNVQKSGAQVVSKWCADDAQLRVGGVQSLIQIVNFAKHQHIHPNEKLSILPIFIEGESKRLSGREQSRRTGEQGKRTGKIRTNPDLISSKTPLSSSYSYSPKNPPTPQPKSERAEAKKEPKPEEGVFKKEPKPKSSIPRPSSKTEAEIHTWLDVVAPLTGAKSRQTMANAPGWREVVTIAVAEGRDLTAFLATVTSERARNKASPQFFTPKKVLEVFQATSVTATEDEKPKWTARDQQKQDREKELQASAK